MSRENVEVVERFFEAWIVGDLDLVIETCDPAVVLDATNFEGWLDNKIERGADDVRRFLEQWRGSWERYEARADEYLDVEGDRVLVFGWQRGLGPGSRVPVEMDYALIFTLHRGLVRRMDAYSERREALEAAGLSE